MAIREYIGARYVPRFMGTYDATQVYEALDVVDNGLGTSYISKIPTPAGTPLTNTTYWTIYGASSGAVISLQNQIDDMKDGTVPGSLQNQIDDLDSEVPKRTLEISERTFLFMGDSYDIIQMPSKRWTSIAATAMGATDIIRRCDGGYGFVGASAGRTWQNMLINNPLTAEEAARVTDIVIGGGANDVNANQSDVLTAIWDFDTYVKGLYPNLKRIYLGFMAWNFATAASKQLMRACYNTYLTTSQAAGWHWLNGVEFILHDPNLIDTSLSDRVHPNADGVDMLGRGVAQAIMTGYCRFRKQSNIYLTLNTAKVSAGSVTIPAVIDGNFTQYYPGDIALTAADNLSGNFLLGSSALELNYPQDRYVNVNVLYNGTAFPAFLYSSSDTKDMYLWLRGGSIPNGASFSIIGTTFVLETI